MKIRFTTVDIVASLAEIQGLLGLRVNNVYDIDNKSYLIKLSSKDTKAVLLLESGTRLHTTEFEWPKNQTPSGFTMKLRKHIDNRRLESAEQVGVDRIVDFQFGSNEAAYHVILELYDKGNIVLTDFQYTILNILRPRTENEDVKFIVRNVYPVEHAKQEPPSTSFESLNSILISAKPGDNLRRTLNPHLIYGSAVIDHVLLGVGFNESARVGNGFDLPNDMPRLLTALEEADKIMLDTKTGNGKGYIIQKMEKKAVDGSKQGDDFYAYVEFHPYLYRQHIGRPFVEFDSFNKAVDQFFSQIESQKIDMKQIHQEKEALKKLENVKKDHEKRIGILEKKQDEDKHRAELIEMNLPLVDGAVLVVQRAIADQISWKEIWNLIQEAKVRGDPVANAIKSLKLDMNHITMLLSDPFAEEQNYCEDDKNKRDAPCLVDIDLDLTAYANAKRYYDMKRHAAVKELKTIESSSKAYKSAEKKTKQALKEVAVVANIKKARKVHWFEKFYWFISSENYLAIGGRDQQQNEMIVKRHLRPGDIYVHADIHGASSIVVKNPSGMPIPPKTLNEVGTMATCFSAAWNAKVVTSAWWVHHDQVSKTAPTGEYLTTGSFMIRGKKNYLPPCHLIMGFGLLFRLDEESVVRHKDERRIRLLEDNELGSMASNSISTDVDDAEISLDDSDENDDIQTGERQEMVPEDNSTETLDTDENVAFPDTVIDLKHIGSQQFEMLDQTVPPVLETSEVVMENNGVIFLGDNEPVLVKPFDKQKQCSSLSLEGKPRTSSSSKPTISPVPVESLKPPLVKRGQKYKLKKIKEKYKDQDDDDRILAMELLKPAGQPKEPKHKKGKKGRQLTAKNTMKLQSSKKLEESATHQHSLEGESVDDSGLKLDVKSFEKPEEAVEQGSDEEKEEKNLALEDAVVMNSLTGIPVAEDVLIYCVPVCAPYNSITYYKYKVKLTPGSGKRGKAAKTAIAMFLNDKTATQREKDLLKSLKDQDVSRNIPGKVKMSAPQLQRIKKR